MNNRPKNPILDDPSCGWVSLYCYEENCDCNLIHTNETDKEKQQEFDTSCKKCKCWDLAAKEHVEIIQAVENIPKKENQGYRINSLGEKECNFCGTPEKYPSKYHCCDSWRF